MTLQPLWLFVVMLVLAAVGIIFKEILINLGKDLYGILKSRFRKSHKSDVDLKREIILLYKNIIEFLETRRRAEPQVDFKNFKISTQNRINYSSETMSFYDSNFGAKVIITREEFLRKGIRSNELEKFYRHPTNPLGIREVANGLAELAGKLEETAKPERGE